MKFPYTLHPTPNTRLCRGVNNFSQVFFSQAFPTQEHPTPYTLILCPMPNAQCPMPNSVKTE
ncbi:MAG: hypothetical protein F6J93_12740 [Oscillatoria sp. SIO1A7]|nr:hypothetical protein [Oscillatoria sp. SIO1A7]